jgi:aminoglycoside phosphotransferase (APT) family kinase protein
MLKQLHHLTGLIPSSSSLITYLISCTDASISKISWSSYQESSRNRPWKLFHGDYHPANMMLHCIKRRIVLLDFEAVGPGDGTIGFSSFNDISRK